MIFIFYDIIILLKDKNLVVSENELNICRFESRCVKTILIPSSKGASRIQLNINILSHFNYYCSHQNLIKLTLYSSYFRVGTLLKTICGLPNERKGEKKEGLMDPRQWFVYN